MDPNQLDRTLGELRSRGVPIIAVSAAACATPIGAFDQLADLADVCRRHEVWLHVDAAHGGALAFSRRHRHLLAGIEQADSVVCDAHKMMFMPALCALLFYRDSQHRFATFHQDAPYLFDPAAPELALYDSGVVTLECTKRAAALGLWGIWSLFGPQLFADLVDVTIDLAQQLHGLLVSADDFEALHEPQCNIVAFRYLPPELRSASVEQVDRLQLRLRRAVIESGEFYLVQSRLDGRPVLRTTIMNPLTTEDDLRELLESLRRHGRALLQTGH
jgi:L-2,4-diaminobutyrate decarboxylase